MKLPISGGNSNFDARVFLSRRGGEQFGLKKSSQLLFTAGWLDQGPHRKPETLQVGGGSAPRPHPARLFKMSCVSIFVFIRQILRPVCFGWVIFVGHVRSRGFPPTPTLQQPLRLGQKTEQHRRRIKSVKFVHHDYHSWPEDLEIFSG